MNYQCYFCFFLKKRSKEIFDSSISGKSFDVQTGQKFSVYH